MSVSCFICQKEFDLCNQETSVLKCGHTYHIRCLQQWLDTSSSCPASTVTTNNFVPENEDADIFHKGLSDETKGMLKVDCTKTLWKMLTERITTLESKNVMLAENLQKSTNDLQKCSEDLQNCFEEKNAFKQENLRLKLEIEQLKNQDKKTNNSEAQSKNIKKKLASGLNNIQNEDTLTIEEIPSTSL